MEKVKEQMDSDRSVPTLRHKDAVQRLCMEHWYLVNGYDDTE